ncbi:MAG: 50S ribosomal protein L13 [archaeon]
MKLIIDGENATLGRLSSFIAKQALLGKEIAVVNSEKVIITGTKENILEKYSILVKKGGSSQKGPKIIRTPERILKRTIRGMLSHKKGRGSEAFDRIRCYNKIPEEYKDSKKIKSGRKNKGMTLRELTKLLKGGK